MRHAREHARIARRRAARRVDPERLSGHVPVDPLADAERGELRESLERGIARLPEAYRPVFRLYLEHGLEPHEIARTLERPPGTVRAQLARGLDRLRRAVPAGLAAGRALATDGARGLAAVRAAVLARGGADALSLGSTTALTAIAIMNKKAIALAAALVCLGGLAWSGIELLGGGAGHASDPAPAGPGAAVPAPATASSPHRLPPTPGPQPRSRPRPPDRCA